MTKSKNSDNIQFSNNLFWDIDIDQLDFEKNKRFIIQRVLEYGTLEDWKKIKTLYGLKQIGCEMQEVRNLDKISLAFISTITNTSIDKFRCYTTRQSHPQHWNF